MVTAMNHHHQMLILAVGALLIACVSGVQWNNSCKCGQKTVDRIVGGTNAKVNEWPWQVALMYGNSQFCGGSLINDRYVLTAAHCTEGLNAGDFTVRLGDHTLSTTSESSQLTRSVSKVIDHPIYVPGDEINDISLIKLSSPAPIRTGILPVCLPPKVPTYANKVATVTGWGTTSSGGSSSNVLKEVNVRVWSNTECRRTPYGSAIKNTMLCAGQTGKDSCQGDSGGPLVFKDGGNNYDQIGVVSWGYGCAVRNSPGVYTRVNKYMDWIKTNTADGIYCKGFVF